MMARQCFSPWTTKKAMRLTGTQERFTFEEVKRYCTWKANAADRIDYAITVDDELVGEVVLNEIDPWNRSAGFRIAIWYPRNRNRGYGSEALRLIIDHGFRTIGMNRIELEAGAPSDRAVQSCVRRQ